MKKKITYLDTACMGIADRQVAAKINKISEQMADIQQTGSEFLLSLYSYYDKAREQMARLLKVTPEELALVDSTTHGLGLVATALPLEKKDNILICDLEFFSASLVWTARQRKIGFEVRPVKTTEGRVKVDDFASRIDNNTRAIVVSSVQEINGFRVDIKALSRLAREYGAYLIVDGIQEVGAVQVDLSTGDVDIYCAGGHKWLRSPFGLGFLYINKRVLPDLIPDYYGYFNTLPPAEGWEAYLESPLRSPFDRLKLMETAGKFETGGSGNYLGAAALYEMISGILEQGMDTIEARVLELQNYLATGLTTLKLKLQGCGEIKGRSGITTFSLPGGLEEERKLEARLIENRVYISLRYVSGTGGIRVSPHYYNSENELDKLLTITEDFML